MELHLFLTCSEPYVTHIFAIRHSAFSCEEDEAESQAFHLNIFKLCCVIVTNPPLGLATVRHWPKERLIQCNSDNLHAIFKYAGESVIFPNQDNHNKDGDIQSAYLVLCESFYICYIL